MYEEVLLIKFEYECEEVMPVVGIAQKRLKATIRALKMWRSIGWIRANYAADMIDNNTLHVDNDFAICLRAKTLSQIRVISNDVVSRLRGFAGPNLHTELMSKADYDRRIGRHRTCR